MESGKRHWRIAILFSFTCLLTFEAAGDEKEPADGIQTKNYEHPRFGNSSIRYCAFNQYYDEHEGRCVVTPGGGSTVLIDYTTTCDSETLRPHPSRRNYYYACQRTKTIFAKCLDDQQFENRLKRCAITNTKQCNNEKPLEDPNESYNHVQLPSCQEAGQFPISSDNCTYYTCTSNGFRLYREIHRCPSSNGFDPDTGACTSEFVCNRDGTSKNEPSTAECMPEITQSDTNQLTTARPDTMTTIDEIHHDQVTSRPISTDATTVASIKNDAIEKSNRENSSTKEPHASPANVASSTENSPESAVINASTIPLQASVSTEVPYTTETTTRIEPLELNKEESTISPLSSSMGAPIGISEKTMERSSELETTRPSTEEKFESPTDLPPTSTEVPYTTETTVPLELREEASMISPVSSSTVASIGISEKTMERSSESETTTPSAEIKFEQPANLSRTVSGSDDRSTIQEDTTGLPATVASNAEDDGEPEKSTSGKSTDGLESTTERNEPNSSTSSNDQETPTQAPLTDEETASSVKNDEVTKSTINPPDYKTSPDALPNDGITTAQSDGPDDEAVKTTDPPTADSSTTANTSETEKHDRPKRLSTTLDDITSAESMETSTLSSSTLKLGKSEAAEVRSSTNDPSDFSTLTTGRYSSISPLEDENTTMNSPLTFGTTEKEGESTITEEVQSSTTGPWDSSPSTTAGYFNTSPLKEEMTISSPSTSGTSEKEDTSTTMTDDVKSSTNGPWDPSSSTTAGYSPTSALEEETTVSSSSTSGMSEKEDTSTTMTDDVKSSTNGPWDPSSLTTARYSSTSPLENESTVSGRLISGTTEKEDESTITEEVQSSTTGPWDSSSSTTAGSFNTSPLKEETTISSPSTSGTSEKEDTSTTMTDDVKSSTNGPWDPSSLSTARYSSTSSLEEETTISGPSTSGMTEKEDESTITEEVKSSTNGPWDSSSSITAGYSPTSAMEEETTVSSSSTSGMTEKEDESTITEEIKSSTNGPGDSSLLTTAGYSFTSPLEEETTLSNPSTSGMTEKEDVSTTTTDLILGDRWTKLYRESGYLRTNSTNNTNVVETSSAFSVTTETAALR